jgi:hypothetical protein
MAEIGIFRMEGGKIVEKWGQVDRLGMYRQLGINLLEPRSQLLYEITMPLAAGIFGVLAEAAPEIPLLIDTRERREAVSGIVDQCIATGESWVATDGGGVVAGFILVEPDEMERFQAG